MNNINKKLKLGNGKYIRDLSDFCENWNEMKNLITDLDSVQPELDDDAKLVISWLIILADKTCALDS